MTEIRPIREEEAVSYLTLICDVFALDIGRARSIFFNEPMFDLNRKWALFKADRMVSALSTVPLIFGWGRAVGIASVATLPESRHQGYAGELIQGVLHCSAAQGESVGYLFAENPALYSKIGFRAVDDMVRIEAHGAPQLEESEPLKHEEVKDIYSQWADADPARLRRDEQRWQLWKWGMRYCQPMPGGYCCLEGAIIREAICDVPITWPSGFGGSFLGLRGMADRLGLGEGKKEAELMAFGEAPVPQMFLSDQF